MASKMLNVDPTKVKFEDVAGRRKIIQSHYEAQGWTNEEASQALHKRVVEGLCKTLHAAGVKKIGHVYFEYMVDHSTWHDNFKHVKAMGFPVVEWPWPKRPLARDESLGISRIYHGWLQKNGHKASQDGTPGDVIARPVQVEQIQFSSHALRLQLWHSMMGNGPYKTPITGPFEVALPPSLDFHGLVWGEDGEIYKELCSTIHDFLTVGWVVKDGRPVSLVVGFKATHEEYAKKHRNCHDLVMLWGDCLTWVSGLNDGSSLTLVESLTMSDWQRIAAVRDAEFPGHTSSNLDSEVNSDAAK